MKNIICFFLFIISITSCSLRTISNEELFKCLKGIDYTIETGYAVIDGRENNIYDVEFRDSAYVVILPVTSDTIVSIRKYRTNMTDRQRDSLVNAGQNTMIHVPLSADISIVLKDICLKYRSVWQSLYKYIVLGKVKVDDEGNVMIRVQLKKNKSDYNIYIPQADDLNALSHFPFDNYVTESFYEKDYIKLENNLYYREVDENEYNMLYELKHRL